MEVDTFFLDERNVFFSTFFPSLDSNMFVPDHQQVHKSWKVLNVETIVTSPKVFLAKFQTSFPLKVVQKLHPQFL